MIFYEALLLNLKLVTCKPIARKRLIYLDWLFSRTIVYEES